MSFFIFLFSSRVFTFKSRATSKRKKYETNKNKNFWEIPILQQILEKWKCIHLKAHIGFPLKKIFSSLWMSTTKLFNVLIYILTFFQIWREIGWLNDSLIWLEVHTSIFTSSDENFFVTHRKSFWEDTKPNIEEKRYLIQKKIKSRILKKLLAEYP